MAIILGYLSGAVWRSPDRLMYLRRYGVLMVASWVAEDTCIRFYGFYHYHPGWSFQLDCTPLAIILIWPIVILSAQELITFLLAAHHPLFPLACGAMVLADASFMEPIAVNSTLWQWSEPGFFGVPPIGLIGWGYFATSCLFFFQRLRHQTSGWSELGVILFAPLVTHLLLLGSWWGVARWVNQPLSESVVVTGVWLLSAGISLYAVLRDARHKIPPSPVLSRIPASLLFFVLLALDGRNNFLLLLYALAFAPPYLSIIDWSRLRSRLR